MKEENLKREIDQVIKRILPLVPSHSAVDKKEFERLHAEIVQCLHEKTELSVDAIAAKMDAVLMALPHEYGRLPEEQRSWEALIGYLYAKYLKELGKL